ncbi:MAG: hypothetical protein WKF96_18215 [Solirubrobacteraceae bacterium]
MSDPYAQINLDEVEDAAPGNDLGSYWEARVARVALGAEQTGVAHFRLRPGKRSFRASPRERRGDLRGAWRQRTDQARR